MNKMSSLNANTTASADSNTTLTNVVNLMNRYGDQVVAAFLNENPEIRAMTDMKYDAQAMDLARRFFGRVAILHPKQVEEIYAAVEAEYTTLIEALDAMGENTLKAKALDLDARTIKTEVLVPAKDEEIDSPFAREVLVETVDVRKLGKPLKPAEIEAEINEYLDRLGVEKGEAKRPTMALAAQAAGAHRDKLTQRQKDFFREGARQVLDRNAPKIIAAAAPWSLDYAERQAWGLDSKYMSEGYAWATDAQAAYKGSSRANKAAAVLVAQLDEMAPERLKAMEVGLQKARDQLADSKTEIQKTNAQERVLGWVREGRDFGGQGQHQGRAEKRPVSRGDRGVQPARGGPRGPHDRHRQPRRGYRQARARPGCPDDPQ
jgi:hypothetical protein